MKQKIETKIYNLLKLFHSGKKAKVKITFSEKTVHFRYEAVTIYRGICLLNKQVFVFDYMVLDYKIIKNSVISTPYNIIECTDKRRFVLFENAECVFDHDA